MQHKTWIIRWVISFIYLTCLASLVVSMVFITLPNDIPAWLQIMNLIGLIGFIPLMLAVAWQQKYGGIPGSYPEENWSNKYNIH